MLPRVIIIGRPNVGKSTLFNRLVGKKLALVDDQPGVTRDRRFGDVTLAGMRFTIVDTAGWEDEDPSTLPGRMRMQTEVSIADADAVLFVVDARAGLTPLDSEIGNWLRGSSVPVVLVANKAEGRSGEAGILEAYSLGLGDPVPVSAEHGEGTADLFEALWPIIGEKSEAGEAESDELDEDEDGVPTGPLKLAIVGRPNAGKSTFINQVSNANAKVGHYAFTTLVPKLGVVRHKGREFVLADIPGLIEGAAEGAGIGDRFLGHIERCRVLIHLIDIAGDDPAEAMRTVEAELEAYGAGLEDKPRIVALNKLDLADGELAEAFGDELKAAGADAVYPVSGATGAGVEALLDAVLGYLPDRTALERESEGGVSHPAEESGFDGEEPGEGEETWSPI